MKNYKIGKVVLDYRKTHGFTIKEFASQIGISTALLSELERGIGNPTLSVLDAIASAMGISVSVLLERDIPNSSLVRRKKDRGKIGEQGAQNLYTVLAVSPIRSRMELLLLELEPGMRSNNEMSVHPYCEEIAFVISGHTVIVFDCEEILLEEGDTIRILPGRRHVFENRSEKRACVLFAKEEN